LFVADVLLAKELVKTTEKAAEQIREADKAWERAREAARKLDEAAKEKSKTKEGDVAIPKVDCPRPTDCRKMSDYEVSSRGINAHAKKYEYLGKKAPISKFDICICTDGTIRIRPEGKCGKIKDGDADTIIEL